MAHQATLLYTEPLLRQAVLGFWRRSVGAGFVVAFAVVALGLGMAVAQDAAPWLIGAAAAGLALGVAFAATLYIVHHRSSLRKFREMASPKATFLAEDSSFTMSSDLGTTTLQWSAIKELWQFPDVWLLLYSKAQFSTLPLACLPQDMRAFVLQRVRASGGKIAG